MNNLIETSERAEASFLGGLLLDPEMIKNHKAILPGDFSIKAHKNIYKAILELEANEQPIDLVTVSTKLQSFGQLDDITPEYIAEIQNGVPVATHTPQYAEIVKHRSLLRELETVGQRISKIEGSPEEITHSLVQELAGIKKKLSFWSPAEEIETIDPIDTTRKQLTWGTPGLDQVITPIEDHHLIVVAAETKTGKTAFIFDVAIKNCDVGKVLYISLEMSKSQIITRIARDYAGIRKDQWRDRTSIPEQQYHAYKKKRSELLAKQSLVATGLDNRTVGAITDMIKKEAPVLTVIDNLDLIDSTLQEKNDQQESITKQLANFTTKQKTPIILIHHLKKGAEGKQKIRGINAIKGSSKITHNADTILMCHRMQSNTMQLMPKEKAQFTVVQIADRDFGAEGVKTVYFNKGTFEDEYRGENQPGF